MPPWVLLFVQAALAVVGLQYLRHGARRLVTIGTNPALLITVIAPLVLVGPMVFLIGRIDNSVLGFGWIPIGGPVACSMFALASALIVGGQLRQRIAAPGPLLLGTWLSTGVVLLLIASVHELTVVVGQFAFVLAAVILWLNTPQAESNGPEQTNDSPLRNLGLTVAPACSLAQGIVALTIDPSFVAYSGAIR